MTVHTCPAALSIAGEHYPCQQMDPHVQCQSWPGPCSASTPGFDTDGDNRHHTEDFGFIAESFRRDMAEALDDLQKEASAADQDGWERRWLWRLETFSPEGTRQCLWCNSVFPPASGDTAGGAR